MLKTTWHVCHHCGGVGCEVCDYERGWFETDEERAARELLWAADPANRFPTRNHLKGGDKLPTEIVPEISRQLAQTYERTQRELASDHQMANQVWDEALSKAQGFEPSDATPQQFVEAHAAVSILEQVLTSVSGRAGFFNGNT